MIFDLERAIRDVIAFISLLGWLIWPGATSTPSARPPPAPRLTIIERGTRRRESDPGSL